MKLIIAILMGLSTAFAANHTRVISKVTDIYQIKSGDAQLIESEFEVGTFNEVDGLATDIETITEKHKDKKSSLDKKLATIVKLSGSDNMTVTSKKVSEEICSTQANKKYCSTSIELTF